MSGGGLVQILRESRYTTILTGYGMILESGYPVLRDGDASYAIEEKYGYSAEEIFSGSFYSTKTERFFEFYHNEILAAIDAPPGKCFYEMAELEKRGLFQTIITRRIFGLAERAGCKNVINLHGNVYENYCPRCGRTYSVEYVKNCKRVPLCESCNSTIRPNVCLFGEMVDNSIITKAAEEIQRADVLLVLGTHLKTNFCSQLVNYYEGDKLIVVNAEPHYSDRYADVVIHERVDTTLEKIIQELGE